ncbi:MAG: AAA family ATPase [Bacteroidetes bacterium]|nr:AAA family ATPase [Bacteroidota bacterium]
MDDLNPEFRIAADYIQYTDCPVFLTGKAGTGKTTFLKYIKDRTHKSCAVIAPTGVAAINAGGCTIHSFLQIPFTPFIPETNAFNIAAPITDKHQLLSKIRLSKERVALIQKLELLIIDEISMVRCDLLDEIDIVLRHVRKNYEIPFGGVQVLLIGDLMQLAPVARKEEWELLSPYYSSPYFFSSRVWSMQDHIHIVLQHIYRQTNPEFVSLLNMVRNDQLNERGLQLLHQRYDPTFEPGYQENYITLTTHNKIADHINSKELAKLGGLSTHFKAEVIDEFPQSNFPADEILQLKKGAQVMFLKNDNAKVKRYFNGKIGRVQKVTTEEVTVLCESNEIIVKKEKWDNTRYKLNPKTQKIEEETIGSFTQIPLRLAWAITIHKSQGLTFEKAIIDPVASFAAGQVYVALSRCTSLEGLVLLSPINRSSLRLDSQVTAFLKNEISSEKLEAQLEILKEKNEKETLISLFSFEKISLLCEKFFQWLFENAASFNMAAKDWLPIFQGKVIQIENVFAKFNRELVLKTGMKIPLEKNTEIQQRVSAASSYFTNELSQLIAWLQKSPVVTDNSKLALKFQSAMLEILEYLDEKNYLIQQCKQGFFLERHFMAKKSFEKPVYRIHAGSGSMATLSENSGRNDLKSALFLLRDQLALEKNLPVYRVANLKTIEEMVQYLPKTLTQLEKINGFGKIKVQQFGNAFLDIIQDYCEENGLESSIEDIPEKKKKIKKEAKPSSRDESFALFKEGHSVQQIALKRNFTIETIQNHLSFFVGEGLVKADTLLPKEKLIRIGEVIIQNPGDSIGQLKSKLGQSVSYGELQIALSHFKNKSGKEQAY